jgi:hypothetical protein
MALPKIQQPLFELVLPSTGKKVKYRPFTVKEEKILLMAKESESTQQAILSIKQVLGNCLQDVDVDSLATFDVEYVLLNVRGKSVNNLVEFTVTDDETGEKVELNFDIDQVTIAKDPKHTNLIDVTDDIKIVLKYPTIDLATSVREADTLGIVKSCLHQVVEGEDVYVISEFSDKEVSEFIESLSTPVLGKIKEFFDTMPKMKIEIPYTNSAGKKKTFVAKGTETFFI